MRIVEQIGRAGGKAQREAKQKEWNRKYGEGNWEVVYFYDGKIYTREEALEEFYNKSYLIFLQKNPRVLEELCSRAGSIYNPHARYGGDGTNVDLQCPAVECALSVLGKTLRGKEEVAIGTWKAKIGQKAVYPPISYTLSPFKVPIWCDQKISVEQFWQDYKYLAVRE